MDEATLTIGQVAERANVNVSAIRYYERHGLLPTAERVAGQRRFGPETVDRLAAIATAKQAGFSLNEVRTVLEANDAGAGAHLELRALAARKLPEVDALIRRAEAMRRWLETANGCNCATLEECGLFDRPEREEGPAHPLQLHTVHATG